MSTLALELDNTLKSLDAPSAARLDRAVRDVIALVKPDPSTAVDAKGFPPGYFEQTSGAFADIEFARPAQGDLPPAVEW